MSHTTITFTPSFASSVTDPATRLRITAKRLTFGERARAKERMASQVDHPDGREEVLNHTWTVARDVLLGHLLSVEHAPNQVSGYPAEAPLAERELWLEQHFDDPALIALGMEILRRSSLSIAAGN